MSNLSWNTRQDFLKIPSLWEAALEEASHMIWLCPTEEWRWRLNDNAREIGKSGEPWYICNWMSFTRPFLLFPMFFRTARSCSGGYHLERGGMPLHDAVWINCNKGQLLKIKAQVSSIWAKGDNCVWYLTWHDDPLHGGGRKSCYIIIFIKKWTLNIN